MRRILVTLAALLTLGALAKAQDAHPAFWTVHGPRGTVYILSSLHLLPPGTDWHRPDIDGAMKSADSFVFEVPTGASEHSEETQFIYANGLLPAGQTLSDKLDDGGRRDFHRALDLAGMDEVNLNQKRPWLAEVVLTVQAMYRRNYSPRHTPEGDATALASAYDKDVRYLDTTRQQLEFLQGADPSTGFDQFRAVLADFPNQAAREQRFVQVWAAGDVDTAATLISQGLSDLPNELTRLDARNRDWTRQIESMLSEDRKFFVAVGMAHLVGPKGVPALLRADGYTVEGP
ncbi:MAG TPA: TraB/GumN family protein [Rhizomicrobium sp.]|nr:TraB/GumN family protein [Rhizomicrobium sp.]